jgi:putative endonuclease
MYFIYVIKSITHSNRYIGSTEDIPQHLTDHNNGKCRYTDGRKPWALIYEEEFGTRSEAMRRERFLKSGQGRKWLDEKLR